MAEETASVEAEEEAADVAAEEIVVDAVVADEVADVAEAPALQGKEQFKILLVRKKHSTTRTSLFNCSIDGCHTSGTLLFVSCSLLTVISLVL